MALHLNPLRVALLTNYLPPSIVPMVRLLAGALPNLNILLSTEMGRERRWKPEWQDLPVTIQHSLKIRRNWRHPLFEEATTLYFPYDTLWQLYKFQPQVIVSSEMGLRTLQSLIYRRLHPNARLIIWAALSEHSELQIDGVRERIRRFLLRNCDSIVVNGQSGKRYVQRYGVADSAIGFVPYTVNLASFANLPLTPPATNQLRLLYVGQLSERKGLVPFFERLIQWATANAHCQVELTLGGEGPELSVLKAMPLPTNFVVHFLGNVEYSALPQLYAQADLFVFPSLADEWGVVINEAMAAGLPVLGSLYSQAVEEMVEEGKTGWLFRPDHPDEVAAAIARALQTPPEQLFSMRQAARTVALRYSPQAAADQMIAAIRRTWQGES